MTSPTGPGSRWRSTAQDLLIAFGLLIGVPIFLVGIIGGVLLLSITYVPPPPGSVSDAVSASLERLRAINGVLEATVEVAPIDTYRSDLDEAVGWRASAVVRIGPELDPRTIAREIDPVISALRQDVATDGVVQVPTDSRGPEMTLRVSATYAPTARGGAPASVVEAAEAAVSLRSTPFAVGVWVDSASGSSSVAVDEPEHLAGAVASAVALLRADGGPLASINVSTSDRDGERSGSVSIAAGSPPPPPEATELVARLIYVTGVQRAHLDAARDATGPERDAAWRPNLDVGVVSVGEADAAATALAGLSLAIDSDTPRPSFRVTDASIGRVIKGYLGLPLGSDEPADAFPGQPAIEAPITRPSPEQEEAAVRSSTALVESVVREAVSTAGADLDPGTEVIACDTGGRQATGSALIPVTDGGAGQQRAFNAIVESWEERGFTRTDRALGTDLYSGEGLRRLSIRGTADGIRISVESECSV